MKKRKMPTQKQLDLTTGDMVEYTQDDGSPIVCSVRSEPWRLGDGTWVIKLGGKSGGVMLTRCKKLDFRPA